MGFGLESREAASPEAEIRKKYIDKIFEKLNELSGLFYTNPIAYKDEMTKFLDITLGEIGTDFLDLERNNSSHDVFDE
ncbi:MAG: hypothetical protein NTU57_02030 [Candidatus Aenigmarchaeota archaeon]|nr:hypothetical protein [Candidatus Aenigmarchaeota archaeon]